MRDKSERRSGLACMGDIRLVRSCSVFFYVVFLKIIFIGVQLLYNMVLVAATQLCRSGNT